MNKSRMGEQISVPRTSFIHNHILIPAILLGVSFLLFIDYGPDISQYLVYNINAFSLIANEQAYFRDPVFTFMNQSAVLLTPFYKLFKFPLLVPVPFIIASVVVKFLILLILYRIAAIFVPDKYPALAATLLFALSLNHPAHAEAFNGIFGAPIFFRSSVSALFTLAGILLALRNRLVPSSVMFGLSLHFHLFYGITALAFFLPPFAAAFIMENRKNAAWGAIAASILILGANLLYFQAKSHGLALEGTGQFSLKDWHDFLVSWNPDDTFMWFTLLEFSWFLVPFFMYSIFLIYEERNRLEKLDVLVLGGAVCLALVIFLEQLHLRGIFIPHISDIIIGLELKRGIWILCFFALLRVFRHIQYVEKIEELKHLFLFSLAAAAYLMPQLSTVALTLLSFMIIRPSLKLAWVFAAFFLGVCAYWMLDGFLWTFSAAEQIKLAGMTIFIALVAVFAQARYAIKREYLFLIPIVMFLVSHTVISAVKGRFIASIKTITADGNFSYPQADRMIYRISSLDPLHAYDKGLFETLRNDNTAHDMILYPPSVLSSLTDADIIGSSFFNGGSIFYAFFTKEMFEDHLYRTSLMSGIANPHDTYNYLFNRKLSDWLSSLSRPKRDLLYFNISEKHLLYLKENHHAGYIITPRTYQGFHLLFKGKNYHLYKL